MYLIRLFALLACCAPMGRTFAQNLLITYQAPSLLAVCDTATVQVRVQNTGNVSSTGLVLTATMPIGVSYEPASVVGAVELPPINPMAPMFSMPNAGAGATVVCTFRVRANCAAADQLDAGRLFPIALRVVGSTGSAQVTTTPLKVETGLLRIESVTPPDLQGTYGDTLRRRLCFRNTRLGAIHWVRLQDAHDATYQTWIEGATTQSDVSGLVATFSPDFFKDFGDKDNRLEQGESFCVQQVLVVKDCGEPPSTGTVSMLRAGWSCDGANFCRYDSLLARVAYKPYDKRPAIEARYEWVPPSDRCGTAASPIRIVLRNAGEAPASNFFCLIAGFNKHYAAEPVSFTRRYQGVETSANAFANASAQQNLCGRACADSVYFTIPLIAPSDSVEIRFNTYYCSDTCAEAISFLDFSYVYELVCPKGGRDDGALQLFPSGLLKSEITSEIADCLRSGQTYEWTYSLRSKRLLSSEGQVRVLLNLPHGLTWAGQCLPNLVGGVQPEVKGDTTIEILLKLPLDRDSIAFPFCLRYDCDTLVRCLSDGPEPPRFGSAVVYGGSNCAALCALPVDVETSYLPPSVNPACALRVCNPMIIAVNRDCGDGEGGEVDLDSTILLKLDWSFTTYRLNRDYADNNDDRLADPGLATANAADIRLDRYVPGDTMRVDYRGKVAKGSKTAERMTYVVWHEVIQSDQDTSDRFDVIAGQALFTNYDRIKYVRKRLWVYYKDGTVGTCVPQDSFYLRSDQKYYKVETANVPDSTLDALITQRHEFAMDFKALFNQGCLPKPTVGEGDSLVILTDFKINTNFTPVSANDPDPPLVRFRTAFNLRPRRFAWDYLRFKWSEYSGFRAAIQPNLVGLQSCVRSNTIQPFLFRLRIARPNFFPFEVRPFTRLADYRVTVPPGLVAESAILQQVLLQDSVPRLSNVTLPFAQTGSILDIDFAKAFEQPLDEAFILRAFARFAPACNFTAADSSRLLLTLQSQHGFYFGSFAQERVSTPLTYYSGAPQLGGAPQDTLLFQTARTFTCNVEVRNKFILQAPNAWMMLVSPSGQIVDLKLQDRVTQQDIAANTQGIYQLGTLSGFGRKNLRVIGNSRSCATDTLLAIFGWGCTPVNAPAEATCGRDTLVLFVRTQKAELELALLQEPDTVAMCAPSGFYEIEVYNANEGSAYDVLGTVKLPQGVRIAPGSCGVSYPAGATFVPLADPQSSAGNQYTWNLSQLLPALTANGLPGIDAAPAHAVRIRFRVLTDCGFAANLAPVYGADGISNCGQASNALNKPGKPMRVAGLGAPYEVQVGVRPVDGPARCGGSQRFEVALTLLGTSNPGDSALVLLPPDVTYNLFSYVVIQNAPPQVSLLPNGFRIAIPPGLPASTVVGFRFAVRYATEPVCDDQTISIQTRIRSEAFCPTLGANCPVFISTGETSINVGVQHPNFGVLTPTVRTENNQSILSFTLSNLGNAPTERVLFQLRRDLDGDGQPDPTDPLLGRWDNPAAIQPGQNLTMQQSLTAAIDPCGLLLVLPAVLNCACEDKVYPIEQFNVNATTQSFCAPQTVPLGVQGQTGLTYTWTPTTGLSCTNCPQTVFTPDPGTGPGSTYQFELLAQQAGCTTKYSFSVVFGPTLSLAASRPRVCRGGLVTLTATPGLSSYQWSGPGTGGATGATLTLSPQNTATYSVIGTFPGGCLDTAAVTVTALLPDTVRLPERTTCAGVPVTILGQTTAQAGTYQVRFKNQFGCDSLVFQTLRVLPQSSGQSEQTFCQGDTLRLFDTLITATATVCRTFKGQNGCDSIHCIAGRMLPQPVLPQPDTIFSDIGKVANLQGPPGFVRYQWSPQPLSCDTCRILSVTPDKPGLYRYQLTVLGTNGCSATVTYLLFVNPPCSVVIGLSASAPKVCRGAAVTLTATPGLSTYQWAGPGTGNATGSTLTVSLQNTATYTVVGTAPNGCQDTAFATVVALVPDTVRLPERTTCTGVPVNIFGQTTAQAGTYELRLKNQFGCDSLVYQALRVLSQTTGQSERIFCQGDTLTLFDTLITTTKTVCRTFKGQNGCDSLHCVTGRMVPKPVLSQPDTIFGDVGQVINLQGPSGFARYRWTPLPLSCDTCQNLAVTPDTAGLYRYHLAVSDVNRCGTTTTYLVFVSPPCDPVTIILPNAFTPNGDGLNDVFRPVEQESLPFTATLQIYSRWGQKLYESTGAQVAWDGTVDGEPAPMDTYIFILEVACENGKKGKKWGDVSLLR